MYNFKPKKKKNPFCIIFSSYNTLIGTFFMWHRLKLVFLQSKFRVLSLFKLKCHNVGGRLRGKEKLEIERVLKRMESESIKYLNVNVNKVDGVVVIWIFTLLLSHVVAIAVTVVICVWMH